MGLGATRRAPEYPLRSRSWVFVAMGGRRYTSPPPAARKEFKNVNPTRFVAALLAFSVFSVAGCKCGPGTVTNKPDYVANPTALAFTACPTKDEQGHVVDGGVFPDEQKLTVQNQGKAMGTFDAVLSGPAAAQFKLDPMRTPMAVGANDSVVLPIQFSPVAK